MRARLAELRIRRRVRGPALEHLPLEPRGDLGGGALRLARLRAEPPPERGALGRPDADPRPRLGHRRLGALGQRLVPADRRARLRRRAARRRRGLLPALPADARRRSAASFGGHYVARRDRRLARGRARLVRAPLPARRGRGSAPTARAARSSTSPCSRWRSSSRPSTASRSSSRSRSRAFLLAERGRWLGAGRGHRAGDADADRRRRAAACARGDGLAPAAERRARAREPLRRAADLRRLPAVPRRSPAATASRSPARRASGTATSRTPGPLGGIWDGLRAAWAGVRQLVSGSHTHYYWSPVRDADPMRVAAVNLEAFAFLVLLVALTVIAWRRFGAPYGLFCGGQPGDPAERAERALAAALDAAVRARPLPVLPGARGARRPAARAHRDPRRQLDHARRRRHPVGALAMGRVAAARRRRAPARRDRLRRALGADRPGRRPLPGDGPERRPAARRRGPGQADRRPRRSGRASILDGLGAGRRDRRPGAGRTRSTSPPLRRAQPGSDRRRRRTRASATSRGPPRATQGPGLHRARRLDPPGRAGDHPARPAHRRARCRAHASSAASRVRRHQVADRLAPGRRRQRLRRHRLPQHRPRPVADRRRAARGARDERRRRQTREAGPVDVADLLRLDPQVYLATSDAEVTLMDLRAGTRDASSARSRTAGS